MGTDLLNPFSTFKASQAAIPTTNYDPLAAEINANLQQGNNQNNAAFQAQMAQQLMAQSQGNGTQGQQDVAGALRAQAAGQGPSLAQGQLASATNQNVAQAASQAASARGLNPAMAARTAGQNQAMANQQAAGQSAQLRSGEQMQAQGALAQQANTVAGQNLQASQLAGGVAQGLGSQYLGQQQTANSLFNSAAGAQNQQNATAVTSESNSDATNASIANQNAATAGQIDASFVNATGQVVGALGRGHYSGGLISGDSPKNDIVPAMLSPGEIVLPRSVTQSDDPAGHAAEFVAALKGRHGYADGGTVADVAWNPNSLAQALALGPVGNSPVSQGQSIASAFTPAVAITPVTTPVTLGAGLPMQSRDTTGRMGVLPGTATPTTDGSLDQNPTINNTTETSSAQRTPDEEKTGDDRPATMVPGGTNTVDPVGVFYQGGLVNYSMRKRNESQAN